MKSRNKLITSLTIALSFLAFPIKAHAVCPICTIAVGAGLGISRWIGIDDAITGIWVGGLILSSGLWLGDWVSKKKWRIPYPNPISVLLMFLFVIPPLYWSKMIGLPGNLIFGTDKVLFGTIVGAIVFLFGTRTDKWLRTMNSGKVYVYYQRVIVPVFLLTLASYILYLIDK
jgi:hypothetical protein